jgi:phage terminase Nu1 subunit (DNA packaging protein)
LSNVFDIKSIFDISKPCLQKEFAALIGVSEMAVSNLVQRQIISQGQTLGEWLTRYCAHIREQAAGRATKGELDLATERAGLAREQKIRIEMQNAVTRREFGPIEAMELGLSDVIARVASHLDTIPGKLKIASDQLTAKDLNLVAGIVAKVRNEIASLRVDWFGDKTEGDDDIDVELED